MNQQQAILTGWKNANLEALAQGKPLVVSWTGLDSVLGFAMWESISTELADLNHRQQRHHDVTPAHINGAFREHLAERREISFESILTVLCAEHGATEAAPLKLGNVSFFYDGPDLVHSLPTSKWDMKAVVADMNRLSVPVWDKVVSLSV